MLMNIKLLVTHVPVEEIIHFHVHNAPQGVEKVHSELVL